ncbi:hypothetical protein K0M31_016742 [Melipona bicolor]|uniref:Uncharacterized protein n=1 Tax=Melipona bicolor TaxID=60889 RepID=A0AA40FE59_9HYME|nr:hypothetical protein K0M31_016742 [Melipona bicolor]
MKNCDRHYLSCRIVTGNVKGQKLHYKSDQPTPHVEYQKPTCIGPGQDDPINDEVQIADGVYTQISKPEQ